MPATFTLVVSSAHRRRGGIARAAGLTLLAFLAGISLCAGSTFAGDGRSVQVPQKSATSQSKSVSAQPVSLPLATHGRFHGDTPWGSPEGEAERRSEPATSEAEAPRVPEAEQTILFAHRVGDTYRLRIERTVREQAGSKKPQRGAAVRQDKFAADIHVEVVSLYNEGYVVELHWLALERNGRRVACFPPAPENAAIRDSVGGGVLRIAVQSDGTATSILNWLEVRDALTRFHRTHALRYQKETKKAVDFDAMERRLLRRAVVEPVLLGDWNQIYAACGVTLRPGKPLTRRVEVPTTGGLQATLPAVDVQVMDVYRNERDAIVGLVYTSKKEIGARPVSRSADERSDRIQSMLPGSQATKDIRVDERVLIHFDAETQAIHGTRRRDLHTGGRGARHVVETLRFSELPAEARRDSAVPDLRAQPLATR